MTGLLKREPGLAGSRILIVDDQPENVKLLENIFAAAGLPLCRVTTNPREASTICAEFAPDLVLLDLHMPGLDGIAVLEDLLRNRPEDQYLPVLVVTSDASTQAKVRAFTAGAADFLAKPFDLIEVVLRARRLLMTRALLARLAGRSGPRSSAKGVS